MRQQSIVSIFDGDGICAGLTSSSRSGELFRSSCAAEGHQFMMGMVSVSALTSSSRSGRLFQEFVSGCRVSIFVRKTLRIRLRDRKMRSILQARKEGYAFFDEDDTLQPGP